MVQMGPLLQAKNVFEIRFTVSGFFPVIWRQVRDWQEAAEITAINTNDLKRRSKTVTIIYLTRPSPSQ